MDRRQQKTRAAIFAAFEHLLERQSYSKITVQNIIDGANVGRTTFYAHFETKDALLRELCADLFAHVFSDHPSAETSHDFSLSQGNARTIVAHILYHLREHGSNLARLMTGESGEDFLNYFRPYLNELVVDVLLSGLDTQRQKVPQDFLQNHVSGSFVNMVQWWIKGGMQESPEQLADYFLAVIGPILE